MKVTLDLGKLLAEGRITPEEFEKFRRLGARDTGSLAVNILLGFGVVAVSGSALALAPNAWTAAAVGALLFGAGLGMILAGLRAWAVLATILMLVGALMLSGGAVILMQGSPAAFLLVAAMLTLAGICARSGLLIAGAVLALSCVVGARTGYVHALYYFGVREPTLTIALFGALAFASYWLSRIVPPDYERLALVASRTAVFMVNLAFWIGSLWGDRLVWLRERLGDAGGEARAIVIPDWVFAVGWAVALLAAGVWAMQAGRRWLVNVAAVFGAIHFYTQYFERLGASPASVMAAGLLVLAFAFGLWKLNQRAETQPA